MSTNAIRSRAPLLWLLGPLISGYALGEEFKEAPVPLLGAVGWVGAIAALVLIRRGSKSVKTVSIWSALFLVSATFLSWGYYLHRLNPVPVDWTLLPPREAELVLETKRTFRAETRYGQTIGIALIKEAPRILEDLVGQKVYFQLDPLGKGLSPVRSEIFLGRGILSYIGEENDPESFDHYLNRTGTYFELRRGPILEQIEKANWFYRFCESQNKKFEAILRLGSKEENEWQNPFTAMLLGKKSALTSEQRERYLASGTMHFFAISGLHVGAAALAIYYFFLIIRLPRTFSAIAGLVILFFYVQITGGAPSATRAFLMVFFFWGAAALTRKPAPFSALVLSAMAVLLAYPVQIWNSGFQLSYAVVGAILLYGVPLGEKLVQFYRPFGGLPEVSYRLYHRTVLSGSRRLFELFAVSLAASLMSSPFTIQYFHLFTPGAVILNMVLVPLAGLLVAGGIISLFCGLIKLAWLSTFFNHGCWLIIWCLDEIINVFLEIPGIFWRLKYDLPGAGPMAAIIILGVMLVLRAKKTPPSGLAYCLPAIILGLVVVFGTHSLT